MSVSNTQDKGQAAGEQNAQAQDAAAADGAGQVTDGRDTVAKLREILAEQGRRIKEMETSEAKRIAAEAAAAKAAEEAEAKKRGDFEKLISERDEQIAALRAAEQRQARELISALARAELHGLDELQLRGALTMIQADMKSEDVPAWAAKFREEHAANFAAPTPAGVRAGTSGEPMRGASGDLRSRLKSADPAIKEAALRERLSKQLSGELPTGWE
jgi:colicin import membrane protein